jgi:hypothetical protein
MSHPYLDPDLARALQVLERVFGPDPDPDPPRVLSVRPTPPRRRPATPPAPAAAELQQTSLFDPDSEPAPSPATWTTDPLSHLPPSRRWRGVPRHARPLSPAPALTRRSL